MPRRRLADSGSYETVGSQKWIIKYIAAAAAAAAIWIGSNLVGRLKDVERQSAENAKLIELIEKINTRMDAHAHPRDGDLERRIADTERRLNRIDSPRSVSWERRVPPTQ